MNRPPLHSELPLFRSSQLESRKELCGLLELAGLLAGAAKPVLLLTVEARARLGTTLTGPVIPGEWQTSENVAGTGIRITGTNKQPFIALALPGEEPFMGFLGFSDGPSAFSAGQETRLMLVAAQVAETLKLLYPKEDRKKADKEIQKLSIMARETRAGIIITDHQIIPTWVNKAFEDLLGYSRKELLGRDVLELVIGPHIRTPKSLRIIKKRLKRKKSRSELLIHRKDGNPVWVRTISAPLFDDQGTLESMVTMVVDITADKKKEEELKTLSLVASRSLTGAAINDPAGNAFWVNKAFELLSGYSLDELQGKKIGDVLAGPETDLCALEQARRLSLLKKPYEVEILNYKKDGTPFWVRVSGNPVLDERGNITHHVEIMNDITLRKVAELELIRTREEALKLSTAKELFFSVMSHEIRTPLNSILGITEMLLDDGPRADQEEMLNLLKFSGENLRMLINDILDLTKMETGHLTLESTPVDLRELSEQTIRSMTAKAEENQTRLILQADPALPGAVLADPVRIYQILMNLVGNAIKFTKGGTVTVSLETMQATDDDVKVHFCISDTGIGIPADRLESVFQPYTQASADTTRKYGGTGLGLAIVRNLLRIHGTEIRVESEPGRGSAFSFAISFRQAEGEQQATSPIVAGTTCL